VKFIIDAQSPPALARTLRAFGCEAFAVRGFGLRHAPDAQLWNYALQHGAAIVTKAEDFAQRCLYSHAQPVIVWSRVGNSSNPALLGRVHAPLADHHAAHWKGRLLD
jgi:predicted nuclease of predicted toxin-antitoxin system